MKYTKGPWEAIKHATLNSFTVYSPKGHPTDGQSLTIAFGIEKKANALLISKAPAMYEALKQILKGVGTYNHNPLVHAENVINDMKCLATSALEGL